MFGIFAALGAGLARGRQSDWDRMRRLAQRVEKLRMEHGRSEGSLTDDEQALLASIDRQRNQSPRRSTRACPRCGMSMVIVAVEGVELDCCTRCGGIWLDPGELRSLTLRDRDVPGAALQSRRSGYRCPVCEELMIESVFMRARNLLVDRCPAGHGVFLEKGELERALRMT